MGKIKAGFIPDPPDDRDLQFGAVMGVPPATMPSWEKGYNIEDEVEVEDDHQGFTLGCVSFGSTSDTETSYYFRTGKKVKLSQRWIYSKIRSSGGGSSPRNAYKLLQQEGVCEDSFMPTKPSSMLSEASISSKDMLPGAKENALKYRIGKYFSISPYDWDQYIQAIYMNKGCGFGYVLSGGNMGHFVFAIGYKMIGGNQALIYHDSYSPYVKHIIKRGNNFYKESGQQIQLYSSWTAEPGDWHDYNMSTKLVRKKDAKEVFLLIAGQDAEGKKITPRRYWVTSPQVLEDLNAGGTLGAVRAMKEVWESIEEVDVLPGVFEGDIVGSKSVSQILKEIFGKVQ